MPNHAPPILDHKRDEDEKGAGVAQCVNDALLRVIQVRRMQERSNGYDLDFRKSD
jgi:hypothetical protein